MNVIEFTHYLADVAWGAEDGRMLMPAILIAGLAEKKLVVVHRR